MVSVYCHWQYYRSSKVHITLCMLKIFNFVSISRIKDILKIFLRYLLSILDRYLKRYSWDIFGMFSGFVFETRVIWKVILTLALWRANMYPLWFIVTICINSLVLGGYALWPFVAKGLTYEVCNIYHYKRNLKPWVILYIFFNKDIKNRKTSLLNLHVPYINYLAKSNCIAKSFFVNAML